MGRKYDIDDLRGRLIDLLQESKVGMSGVEISQRLKVNRITMTKYLGIFSTGGLINQKSVGNVNMWFIDEGVKKYRFPDDYFEVQKRFMYLLSRFSSRQACGLIRNCMQSGATIPLLVTEVVVPSIFSIRKQFEEGKIGTAEEGLMSQIISDAIKLMDVQADTEIRGKNVVIMSADTASRLMADTASALYHGDGWNVFLLGDMSSAVDMLFDLDLQRLLSKVWKKKREIMIVIVFSRSEGGISFFADAINTVKTHYGKNLLSVMSGPTGRKTSINADLVSEDLDVMLQWSQNAFERTHA